MKVLFVQSSPFLSTALKVTLKKAGFNLIVLEDTAEAGFMLQALQPNIVITDISQHGGLNYVIEAKKRQLPVIVLSANGKESDLQKAFEQGADDYVSLPLSISELALRVNILATVKLKEVA